MGATVIQLGFSVAISPTLKIRGIVATREIRKGDVIEKCPIILINRKEENALKRTELRSYYCEWDSEYHCIALGYGSLINHSYAPNARYRRDYRNRYLVIQAIRVIRKREEITMNYNYHPDSQAPLEPHFL